MYCLIGESYGAMMKLFCSRYSCLHIVGVTVHNLKLYYFIIVKHLYSIFYSLYCLKIVSVRAFLTNSASTAIYHLFFAPPSWLL